MKPMPDLSPETTATSLAAWVAATWYEETVSFPGFHGHGHFLLKTGLSPQFDQLCDAMLGGRAVDDMDPILARHADARTAARWTSVVTLWDRCIAIGTAGTDRVAIDVRALALVNALGLTLFRSGEHFAIRDAAGDLVGAVAGLRVQPEWFRMEAMTNA